MKKILLTLTVIMLMTTQTFADKSGTCGNNVTWTLNETTGVLTISGTGKMYNYGSYSSSPFYESSSIIQVVIQEGITSIGEYTFLNCRGLTSITIPNSVTSIGKNAFSGCSGLTSITIPNSVTSIEYAAFYNCSGLTSITIPNSVTSIEDYAFNYCSGLTSITIPNSVISIGNRAFQSCRGLTSIDIPNSVTSIGDYAFNYCSGLTSITIPNSVTSIGESAFEYCSGLTSITIPNSVTSIGRGAFEGCSGLTEIVVEEGNTSYLSENGIVLYSKDKTNLIYAINAITGSYSIPNSVTSIGEYAFYNCSGLTSITIPNSVTSIGEYAFLGCSGLTSITIPNSVTSIGKNAFSGCSGLTSITIPNSVTSIEYAAFYNCSGLTSITIPNSVTSIGGYAFDGCYRVTHLTIPGQLADKVTNRVHLNTVTITEGSNVIKEYSFSGCTALRKVTIPESCTIIYNNAFANCTSLDSIVCKAKEAPLTYPATFPSSIYTTAKLLVPEGSYDNYANSNNWKNFTNIEDGEARPDPKPCATPQIAYKDGKLEFTCATEGAEFYYSITPADTQSTTKSATGTVDLQQTYSITVYAKAQGYLQSETVTATLYIAKGSLDGEVVVADVNGDGSINSADVVAVYNSIINGK